MTEPSRARPGWVDMGGIQRLADRAARDSHLPRQAQWRDGPRPVLGPHWPLADLDWHRRRSWIADGRDRTETDHQFTRYALLPDGRLVRADTWGSETGGTDVPPALWTGEVRAVSARDVHVLDQQPVAFSVDRGPTVTWGTRPSGETVRPWTGAGMEILLRALLP